VGAELDDGFNPFSRPPALPVKALCGELEVDRSEHSATLSGSDIERIVQWAGATLQAPHRAISAQRGIVPDGVYVAYFEFGSPASRYGLVPGRRIVEVDGQLTPNLDAFLRQVIGRTDRSSLRIKLLNWNGAPEVITLKLDRRYWPTYELMHTSVGWERQSLE